MGLQVWLPLNGDLKNQGLANVVITNNGATINNNGKIGQCYVFDGSQYITLVSNDIQNIFSSPQSCFSMACWIYLNSDETDRVIIFGNYSANPFINWELAANCTQRLCAGGTSDYSNKTNSFVIPKEKWTHIAVTYDGNLTTFYVDGILQGAYSGANTINTKTASNTFWLGSDNRSGATRLKGRMNDFRLYNHSLSKKEIEELAKGLVLHYKLDGINNAVGENLALDTANKIVTATATGTDVNYTTTLDYGLQSNWSKIRGKTITISCDIELVNAVNTTGTSYYRVGIEPAVKYTDNTTGYFGIWVTLSSTPQTSSKRYSRTITIPDKDLQSVVQNGMYIQHLTNGSATIRNVKVELGSVATPWCPAYTDAGNTSQIIYDSSGYQNNSVLVGTPNFSSDNGKRYSYSNVQANGQYIRSEKRPTNFLPKDAITVNLWQYATSWYNPISCTEGGGWNFENSSGLRFPVYISGVGYKIAQSTITPASTQNAWHMLTGTMDKDNIKIYYDGEEVGTVATGSTNGIGYANNYLFIGAEAAGDTTTPASSSYVGNLSDIRIYATALTPAQIKELYNTSATIDHNGNVYARELVEI